jgi:hypothetical protein
VTAAHAYEHDHEYEVPPHGAALAEAVAEAARGHVVYLVHDGEQVAAIVPPDIAAAVSAAIEAFEDREDIRIARARLADPSPGIPMAQILAEYADDLATYPEEP